MVPGHWQGPTTQQVPSLTAAAFSPQMFFLIGRGGKPRQQQLLGAQHPAPLLPIALGKAEARCPSPKWGEAPLSAGEITPRCFSLVPAFTLVRGEITFPHAKAEH